MDTNSASEEASNPRQTDGSLMSNSKGRVDEPEAPKSKLEVVEGNTQRAWDAVVMAEARGKCANCGSEDRLRPRMVVPEVAGGKLIPSNGIVLCRTCELAMDSAGRYVEPGQMKRPVNFWVSKKLYDRLQNESEKTSFKSMAGLVRFLMTKYVSDPDRFDDLAQYQDVGTDVKVNVWVESGIYGRFKELVDRRGSTVTDALKGLIGMFENEASALFGRE